MLVDDNSNKCVEHDSNSMDVEMEPCQSHSNGGDSNSCSNGNASAVRNSLDAIDEEMGKHLTAKAQRQTKIRNLFDTCRCRRFTLIAQRWPCHREDTRVWQGTVQHGPAAGEGEPHD